MSDLSEKTPATREPYKLKKPLVQGGKDLKVGAEASLTKAQHERLSKAGVV